MLIEAAGILIEQTPANFTGVCRSARQQRQICLFFFAYKSCVPLSHCTSRVFATLQWVILVTLPAAKLDGKLPLLVGSMVGFQNIPTAVVYISPTINLTSLYRVLLYVEIISLRPWPTNVAYAVRYIFLQFCIGPESQNHDIKIANRFFENVTLLRYLGTTVTNKNLVQEEIKRGLNSDNSCYPSVQNVLSSHLFSKNIRIRTYKTIILPVVLYGLWH
jgi:hypothetical protein